MDRNQTLLEAFASIRRALLENDLDALEKLLAHDYCGVDPTGAKHDRRMLLQSYGPGGVQLTEYDTSEISVRVIGDVGLVMGIGAIRGSFDGEQFSHDLRFLDVFVHGDSWRLSVSQVSERKLK